VGGSESSPGSAADKRRARAKATIIAFMGVKGGVGTTTAAMNTAAALTGLGSVILAEIRPMFGSLRGHFNPGRMVRGFANRGDGEMSEPDSHAIPSLLWPIPGAPGLRVLFGPQTPQDCVEIDADWATEVLYTLAAEADFVVADLPVSFSAANRAILGASHHLILVLEPNFSSLNLGKLTLEGIHSWERRPASIGAVVVKRSPEGVPISIPEMETSLQIPINGIVPPALELCVHSERARAPMIHCDPDSLVTDSFLKLARSFPLQPSSGAPRQTPPRQSETAAGQRNRAAG
jgi:pilus assembly protein CpaE